MKILIKLSEVLRLLDYFEDISKKYAHKYSEAYNQGCNDTLRDLKYKLLYDDEKDENHA